MRRKTTMGVPCLLLLVVLLARLAPAVAAEPSRQVVDRVADRIEREYFDPDRGRRIAADLRAEALRGEFDAQRGDALAQRLTRRLRPLDRHFRVEWTRDGDTAPRVRDDRPPPGAAPAPRPLRDGPAPVPGATPARRAPPDIDVAIDDDGIGWLTLRRFAELDPGAGGADAAEAITTALDRLAEAKAVVVDVRGNGGGSPEMVGYVVSAFVAPGSRVYNTFHTRDAEFSEAPAQPYAHPRPEVPLYVLIDGRTASAAESFAYTLQQAGRAVIVGQVSAGAANPGQGFDVGDGYRVFVSTGSPINPVSGGNWEGVGIVPDHAAPSPEAKRAAVELVRARLR